tara:strand:+ start:454 stop:855 length:402 start_codon:yes stop_codon:yes gene_type:complete
MAKQNWMMYFQSIQSVCPWSYKSYQQGRILIRDFDEDEIILRDINWDDRYDAVVYQYAPWDCDDLEYIVESLNIESRNCEYFFSHPDYTKGLNNQTVIPVVIQQDRAQLKQIRHQRALAKQINNTNTAKKLDS